MPADRIRNVALVGHRGSGKTSLNEALLYEAGAINRLGSVADGTTVSDSAPDEKARQMSIASSLASFTWEDRKVNLIDTPGEPSFVADAMAALRVCESAVFVVNGVMGVEVNTDRLWERASELGRPLPEALGVHLDAHDRVHHEHRPLADPEGGERVRQEARLARRVDQVDLAAVPLERRQRGGDRHLARLLVRRRVGDRRPVSHRAKAVDRSRLIQEGLVQRGLPAASVAD